MADAHLRYGSDHRRKRITRECGDAFELAGEAVLAKVLAGCLRHFRIQERGCRRRERGRLTSLEREGHRYAGQFRGCLDRWRRERARAIGRGLRRALPALAPALGGEPAADRSKRRSGAEIGGEDHPQEGDDHERHAGSRAAEDTLDAGADPAAEVARVCRPDHPGEPEQRDHRDGAPQRGKRSRAPLRGQAEADAGEDEPGNPDPGADAERGEQAVMHRTRHRPAAGQEEDRGEDDAGSDRSDPGELASQVAMQERTAQRRGVTSAWTRGRTPGSCGALTLARWPGWGGASHEMNSM